LHRDTTIIDIFKDVYATEKIHGTSAWITLRDGSLHFHGGGIKHDTFKALFDEEELLAKFEEIGHPDVKIHGEAYGGKCQRMSNVYGKDLKFIVFEVKIGDHWLDVEKACHVATRMGFEFVHWVKGPATLEFVNKWRDAPSEQARRNGMGNNHTREGIVIRPPIEVRTNNGERLLAKHKHPDFRETRTVREVSPIKKLKMFAANAVAEEYVVPMRLDHVLDKLMADEMAKNPDLDRLDMTYTGQVVRRMIDDIKVEEGDDIKWSPEIQKAIGKRTTMMFKQRVTKMDP